MRMSDFVVRDAIIPELTATAKEDVIREMVSGLHAAGQLPNTDIDDIVGVVLRREQLGSTGIGRGIAIPHSRHPAVSQLVGTLALSRPGIPYDSIDGEPVFALVLLVSPQDRPGDHLRALECVVQTMKDDGFVRALRGCETSDQIWELLDGTQTTW